MASHDLLSFLKRLQGECGGSIPFERFMQEALYHPTLGYYSANIRDVGAKGDFSTSVTLNEKLGKAIAEWIRHKLLILGWNHWSKRIPLIEIGAGNGSLARTILRSLDWGTRLRIDYMIHETSPALRARQGETLRWHGVRWIPSLSEALKKTAGRALIFSNELVDAFPCRLFEKGSGGWDEIGVRIGSDGSLFEIHLALGSSDPWFAQFDHLPIGQRIERHESYRDWLQKWSGAWKEGSLLTIDYGDSAEKLYIRRTPGSLRAYRRHERITGPKIYAHFGKQDLTADVNFSDLMLWGRELGWNSDPLITQKEFLSKWLPGKNQRPLESTSTSEAENAFRVLEQNPN